jgi:hypothetical protein
MPSPKAMADKRRLVRVVEGARLESVYTGNRIEGSNPSVSAFARRSFSIGGFQEKLLSRRITAGYGGRSPPKESQN